MNNSKQVKILVTGDVRGQFATLIKRVNAINAKAGPFELLFCVGEFFGDDCELNQQLLQSKFDFPLQTYILGPCCSSTAAFYPTEGCELTANLTYLGKKGLLTTASGVSVAYLSGIEGDISNAWQFDAETIDQLLVPVKVGGGYIGVDLLLTCQWPSQVLKYAPNRPVTLPSESLSSELISKLAAGLKPRYHFCGNGPHYERAPYRNHRVLQEAAQQTTRFIGLASVNNVEKEKWIYAFNFVPLKLLSRAELIEQPPNASEFPYMELLTSLVIRRNAADEAAAAQKNNNGKSNQQYFFDMSAPVHDPIDRGGKRRWHENNRDANSDMGEKRAPPQPCWFCLSNVGVEKHLVIAIGDSCYLALAKGGLTQDHVLILPVAHVQSVVAAPDAVRQDIDRFKKALMQMFAAQGKCAVFFERNYRTQHLQIQVIPVPIDRQQVLKTTFFDMAAMKGFELTMLADDQQLWDTVNEGCPYFYVEQPDGNRFFTRQMKNFPLQFGREVLANKSVLNMEERVDWRTCEVTKAEQEAYVKAFKTAFAPYDFTDDD